MCGHATSAVKITVSPACFNLGCHDRCSSGVTSPTVLGCCTFFLTLCVAAVVQELLNSNMQQNLQLVVQVAKEYTEQLGADKIIGLLESVKSYHGLYYYLGSYLAFSEDPEVCEPRARRLLDCDPPWLNHGRMSACVIEVQAHWACMVHTGL